VSFYACESYSVPAQFPNRGDFDSDEFVFEGDALFNVGVSQVLESKLRGNTSF
jgi:hypothetical protein